MITYERAIGSYVYRFNWWGLGNWKLGFQRSFGAVFVDIGPFSVSRFSDSSSFS